MATKKNEPTEQYRAMLGKRLSNAATPHRDSRTKRARTRAGQKTRALADY